MKIDYGKIVNYVGLFFLHIAIGVVGTIACSLIGIAAELISPQLAEIEKAAILPFIVLTIFLTNREPEDGFGMIEMITVGFLGAFICAIASTLMGAEFYFANTPIPIAISGASAGTIWLAIRQYW